MILADMININITPGSRIKTYLILLSVSLILFFFGISQIRYVIVGSEDILGLVNHLPFSYWIGLALILLTSILAFLDHDLKKDAIFITILFVVGLYLVVLPAFVYENPTENANFYPFSEINSWLPTHHLAINNPPHLASYYSWPGFHFLSAWVVTIWGESFDFFEFAKYIPILFLLFSILITFSLGRRLNLNTNRCFLLSFLVLSSWLLITADYAPRSLGMLLFLSLFLLLMTIKNSFADNILVVLFMIAIVLTHSLTALATLPALILLSFYRKIFRFVPIFVIIFGAWYLYQAFGVLELGIRQALVYPLQQIFIFGQQEYTGGTTSLTRIVSHYAWVAYGAIYVVSIIVCIILLFLRRIPVENRKQVISSFVWAIGSAAVTVVAGFTDAFQRTYVFTLVPLVCIIVMSFIFYKKLSDVLLIVIMCLFVALHIPAEYGEDTSWGTVLTSDVKGAKFLALDVKPKEIYYFTGNDMIVHYFDPDLVKIPVYFGAVIDPWTLKVDIQALDKLQYVVMSQKGTDRAVFRWGKDPYVMWPKTLTGQNADFIYNNGALQIYKNRLED
jgi:hypothetical protein